MRHDARVLTGHIGTVHAKRRLTYVNVACAILAILAAVRALSANCRIGARMYSLYGVHILAQNPCLHHCARLTILRGLTDTGGNHDDSVTLPQYDTVTLHRCNPFTR